MNATRLALLALVPISAMALFLPRAGGRLEATARTSVVPLGDAIPHCSRMGTIESIGGAGSRFRVATARGSMEARRPGLPPEAPAGPFYVISALDTTWDADGDPSSLIDTLVVSVGATVRWQLVRGIHTLTNGRDSADPDAGLIFSYLLDAQTPSFDSTFTAPDTLPFFCYFHEPRMLGTLIIRQSLGFDEPAPDAATVLRPPSPNPTPGAFALSFSLPRGQRVEVGLFDMEGRLVDRLFAGDLPSGDHHIAWSGRDGDGRRPAAGVYLVRVAGETVSDTKKVVLLP